MSSAPAHVRPTWHDLSPSAVHGQVILPARLKYFVILLEVVCLVCLFTAGVFIFKGGVEETRLASLKTAKADLQQQAAKLNDELAKRRADHQKASKEATWIRRNMPMQPLVLEVMNSITANVTLRKIEAELADGGAPQMTIKVQLAGAPEAIEKAVTQINEAFFHANLRVLAPPIPQRSTQYTEVTFPVQFPSVDEIKFSNKNG